MTDPPAAAAPKIERALISVSDKTGLVDFARALAARGVTARLHERIDQAPSGDLCLLAAGGKLPAACEILNGLGLSLPETPEALALGLLNEVVPDVATLRRRADETAKLVAGHAPITLEVTKEAVRRIRRTLSRDEGQDLILRAYMSEDFREGMDAFLNKRTPNWKGK